MKNKMFYLSLLVTMFMLFGCNTEPVIPESAVEKPAAIDPEIIAAIESLGFKTDGIVETDDAYLSRPDNLPSHTATKYAGVDTSTTILVPVILPTSGTSIELLQPSSNIPPRCYWIQTGQQYAQFNVTKTNWDNQATYEWRCPQQGISNFFGNELSVSTNGPQNTLIQLQCRAKKNGQYSEWDTVYLYISSTRPN